jgi:hypothetical protein
VRAQAHWDFDQESYKGVDLFLLKWEATDLYDFVWDIPDLSCIRGASKGIDDLVRSFVEDPPTSKCTVLDSMGRGDHVLLLIQGNQTDVEALGKQMVSEAAQKIHCASAFGIVSLNGYGKDGPGLQDAIAECDEQINRMRLRVLNVDPGCWAHCGDRLRTIRDELDRLRLVETRTKDRYEGERGTVPRQVSKRTQIRSDNGQDGRWELVQEVARRKGEDYNWSGMKHPFRQDFNSLAANSRPRSGYMAYLAFDGNGFTGLVQRMKSFKELHLFSDFLVDVQFQTLAELLDVELQTLKQMADAGYLSGSSPHYKERTYQPLQFLYLAGDEGDLVVSGDRGVGVALGLLERLPVNASNLLDSKYPELRDADSDRTKALRALSYSIGLVICHATTPIRLVRDAAHQLIAGVKAARDRISDPDRKPQIDFMVFESHVTTPDTVQAYRERFIPTQTRRPMTCKDFKKLVDMVRKAKAAGLASSQRHRVVAALVSGWPEPTTSDSKALLERLTGGLDTTKFSDLTTYLKALLSADENGRTGFLDFHEIYDWIPNGDEAGGTP